VAEFVSSEKVNQAVKELGIDMAQGYLYGKPFDPNKKDDKTV
jgi:EAL domain-containing protein (putative c-di-GMP-specific phosphodiesterase class I)